MKRSIPALALAAVLILSGCASMLERSYTSSTPHVDYSITEDPSILRAESYRALVNSILYFVGEHTDRGTIRLYNYTGNVEADLAAACSEVTEEDPLGAYAVDTLNYSATRILSYYEIDLRISYHRTAAEVAAIRPVSGLSGLSAQLSEMVAGQSDSVTLRTSYFTGDSALVSHLFWLSFYSNPATVTDAPSFTARFFPEEGPQRILELSAEWPIRGQELADYSAALAAAADALTAAAPPAGAQYTVEELASLLYGAVSYDPNGSHTALDALSGVPVNDLGLLLALEYLCQENGIEASAVSDTAGAQFWLIVSTPSGYRHLLPRDLRPDPESEEPWALPLYTDGELTALNFTWSAELYPACVDYSGTLPD